MKNRKHQHDGFTFFEMLFVLLLASLLIVGGLKYQQSQKKQKVAGVLAHNMYTFSQAVRSYVNETPAFQDGTYKCPIDLPPDSTCRQSGTLVQFNGISWLKNQISPVTELAYLDEDFTFNDLGELSLQRETLFNGTAVGDAAIDTNINRTVIWIGYGALYDLADPENPAPESGLTGAAVAEVNHFRDPLAGPSGFTYTGGLNAKGELIPIEALISPAASTLSHDFLRLDGTNSMRGPLVFKADSTNRNMANVNNVQAQNIKGLPGVTFVSDNRFQGIYNIVEYNVAGLWAAKRDSTKHFCMVSGMVSTDKKIGAFCHLLLVQNDPSDPLEPFYYKLDHNKGLYEEKKLECYATCFQFHD